MKRKLICSCCGYTEDDIIRDVLEHNRSSIVERILSEKKKGTCNCTFNHPEGR